MKKKLLALLLALVLTISMIPGVMAATDSDGRYALNNNDYVHAYVALGDSVKPYFRFYSGNRSCGSEARLYRVELTGEETQEELDAMGYELLKSGIEPVEVLGGWLHSLNYDSQPFTVDTEYLEVGTYLLVANVWTNKKGLPGASDDEIHYDTACGVGIHVMEEDIPIESFEYWACDADGNELKQLTPDEAMTISHENGAPLYFIKVKTAPANATERLVDMYTMTTAGEDAVGTSTVPGFTYEDGLFHTCAQNCGTAYLWLGIDSYGTDEDLYRKSHGMSIHVPCHPIGPVKVQQWYTCTEPGYKCTYCFGYGETCETVYGFEIMPPPGHTLKEVYETITAPTATKRGTGIGLCKNCLSRGIEGHIPAIFSDVEPDAFYSDALDHGYAEGWVSGLTETTFGPTAACNRAQAVTFLWRAAGSPEPETAENPFVDVQAGSFYEKAVLWAVEKGITTGTDSTHFSPDAVCNRATVVTFLYRAAGAPAVESSENPFTDVPAGAFYEAPVLWAVENGITNGLSATEFGPNASCNRAQIVTFLYRAYNK